MTSLALHNITIDGLDTPPAADRSAVDATVSQSLVLPCVSCRKHAHVDYIRTAFSEENVWACPSCGEANRLRLRGRVTEATLRAV